MGSLRILIYSPDSSGLGSAYCTLLTASRLSRQYPNASFLVLTDLFMFGRLLRPPNLDYGHIPSTNNLSSGVGKVEYIEGKDKANQRWKLLVRENMIRATVAGFEPDLVIVQRFPLGMKNEMLETLEDLRRSKPTIKTVLGLWDIPGEANVIRSDWEQNQIYEKLRTLYDEIWVYGTPKLFDPIQEYKIPEDIAHKVIYTGYLNHSMEQTYQPIEKNGGPPTVLVTTGGGKDGFTLIHNYLKFIESQNGHFEFNSHIVCGPLMSHNDKSQLESQAQQIPRISIHRWHKELNPYISSASIVVSMGGYNTCSQILSYRKSAVVVPRENGVSDQRVRAEILSRHGLVEMIDTTQISPENLGELVLKQINQNGFSMHLKRYNSIPLNGLDCIVQRVGILCGLSQARLLL